MFNVFMVAEGISPWFDLTNILTAMVGCTATFVAIIGGLIANKAISDRAEKESIERQLSQVDFEINIVERNIESVSIWINEHDAEDFIQEHIYELMDGKPLSDVYKSEDGNVIDYNDMLPYWNSALEARELFYDSRHSEKNNEGIPKSIVDKLTPFQREFCSTYKDSITDNEVSRFESDPILSSETYNRIIENYKAKEKELEDLLDREESLFGRKNELQDRIDDIYSSHDIKSGIKIFVGTSLINIILPVIFMLFNPTSSKVWYIIETVISFIAFGGGIIVMVVYICSLFPKKDENKSMEKEGVEQNNEQT